MREWIPIIVVTMCSLPATAAADDFVSATRALLTDDAVFFASSDDDVRAVDTRTGDVAWSSQSLDLPLAETDGILVARQSTEHGFRVVLASADDGTILHRFSPISAPPLSDLHEGLGDGKSVVAHIRGDDLYIEWAWRHTPVSGVPPRKPPTVTQDRGLLKIDVGAKIAKAVRSIPPPAGDPPPGQSRHDPAYSIRCGDGWCKTELGEGKIELRRITDTGQKLGPLPIAARSLPVSYEAAGGRHALGAWESSGEGYRMRLFDLQQMKKVAELDGTPPTTFVVRGDRMIGLDHQITVWDLDAGTLLSSFPVQTFHYRGPRPQ